MLKDSTMRLRVLPLIVAVAILVAALAADAQQGGKVPRIGYLGDLPGPHVEALRQGLQDLGYREGQPLVIEYRWAEGKAERLPTLAAELVQLPVDLLIAQGGQASRAAKQATSTILIVMAPAGNPESLGLVASLARPGGNITGVSTMGLDLGGKQLELLKEAVPGMSRVAVLLNPTNPGATPEAGRVMEDAARALGLTLSRIEARGRTSSNAPLRPSPRHTLTRSSWGKMPSCFRTASASSTLRSSTASP